MRTNELKPFCKAFVIFTILVFSNPMIAKQAKEITYTGKIVDAQNQPIAGATVSLYGVTYNYSANTAESKLIEKVSTSNDGLFSFKVAVGSDNSSSGRIISEKEALALGWAEWRMRESQQRDIILDEPKELSGMVVDQTGRPIPQARVGVWLIAVGEEQKQQSLGRPLAEQFLTVTADASGRFAFTNIPPEATADFIVRKAGKAILRTYRSTGYANQKLTFSPDQGDIKLVLTDEARIQGIVVNKGTGQPVAGQKLIITTSNNRPLFGQEPVITNPSGIFLVNALAAGGYIIQLLRPQATLADWVAEPVSVKLEAGQTERDIKVERCKGGILEVLVIEAETNKPLDKASVSIRDEKHQRWFTALSGQDGIAQIRLIPGGYQLSGVYKQGYMTKRGQQGQPVTIKDTTITHVTQKMNEMPKITGVVKDKTGKPLEGVQLKILPGDRDEVLSDSEGKFEIIWDKRRWSSREDTVFCLIARHEQHNLATALEINENKKTLDLTLHPGITFSGEVTDTNGKGISNARVRAMLQLSYWGSPLSREQIYADENGDYEIRAIPPGHNYNINASAKGYGDKDVDAHADNAVNNQLNVETLTLPIANLSISGQIVDTEGHPVSNAQISGSGRNQPRPHTLSDNQGNFILAGLCEGVVYIRTNVRRDGKSLSARVHTDAGAKGIKIVVREGRTTSYYIASKTDEDIIRNNEKAIAGVVLDEKGAPVANVPVSVCCHQTKTEDGRDSWHYRPFTGLSDITNEQGRFAIAIQEDGKYNLRFSPDKHAAMIVYDIPIGTKDLKVTLSDGGTILGHLMRMEKGEKVPIPNVEVKIEQTDRASYTHLGFDRDRTTVTDEEGRFRFEHVRTKIRPRRNRTAKEWKHTARYWKISYGDTSKTIAFHNSNTIDDVELIIKPDLSSSSSLIGNKIPGFDDIKVNLSKAQTKNQKLLICFFDMNQRPSRHYINQLNRRAQELKAKEIIAVAIQTAKVDEQSLNAWLKKSDIDIPIGSIQTDPDEIKYKWGVHALPWLVLTDNKHIVRAEGFQLGELEARINQAGLE